jgi:hypothetical protein
MISIGFAAAIHIHSGNRKLNEADPENKMPTFSGWHFLYSTFSVTYVSVEQIDLISGRQFGQSGSELPVVSIQCRASQILSIGAKITLCFQRTYNPIIAICVHYRMVSVHSKFLPV